MPPKKGKSAKSKSDENGEKDTLTVNRNTGVFTSVREALDSGMPPEDVLTSWQMTNTVANRLVSEKFRELIELWMGYQIPHSVMLYQLTMMQKAIEYAIVSELPKGAEELHKRALDDIACLVELSTSRAEHVMGDLLKAKETKQKEQFNPLYG